VEVLAGRGHLPRRHKPVFALAKILGEGGQQPLGPASTKSGKLPRPSQLGSLRPSLRHFAHALHYRVHRVRYLEGLVASWRRSG
jgi:hypothetical protein